MVFFVRISASARAKREREFVCVSRCEAIGLRVGRLLKIFQKGRERKTKESEDVSYARGRELRLQFASSVISDENLLRGTLADADALTEIFVFEPRSASSSSSSAAVANIARIASIASIVVVVRIERVKVA